MNVPDGWRVATLGEVGTWHGGGTPSKSDPTFWEGGDIPWLTPKDMRSAQISVTQDHITEQAIAKSAVRLVPAQSVAFVVRSGILERRLPSALVGVQTTLNQDMKAIAPRPELLTPDWLALAFQAFERPMLASTRKAGTTVASLDTAKVKAFPIPIPPIAQQRRIVEVVEEHLAHLDAADASLVQAEKRLVALQEGVIRFAVSGGGKERAVSPDTLSPAGTADGKLPHLPRGWKWARLEDVADVVGGVTKDSKKQGDPTYVEAPYLRVANVQRGHLNLDSVTAIRVPPKKLEALRLQPGDVLLNEGGDRDKLARGWVWSGQIDDCIHQNHVFRARIRNNAVDPRYLSHTANVLGGKWAERNGKQTTNLASISLSMIRKMPVILPPAGSSNQIANQLADQLDNLDRQRSSIRAQQNRSAALRRAALAAAFAGRLSGAASDSDTIEEMAS